MSHTPHINPPLLNKVALIEQPSPHVATDLGSEHAGTGAWLRLAVSVSNTAPRPAIIGADHGSDSGFFSIIHFKMFTKSDQRTGE